jgi:hypothetical protein
MRRNAWMILAGLVIAAAPVHAASIDGAWTTDEAMCDSVFKKDGGKVVFTKDADLHGSGFIIAGKTIQGKAARCQIKSLTQKGDTVKISAMCATDVMISRSTFELIVDPEGKLTRRFPLMPEMTIDYHRCKG